MFRPVGSQPPSVYWRRRLVLLASLIAVIALIALTLRVLISSDPGTAKAAGTTQRSSPSAKRTPTPTPSSTKPASTPASSTQASTSTSRSASSSSPTTSSSAPPKACAAASLALASASNKAKYSVGDQPDLSILVTNKGSAPCVQNLADSQVLLRVYNGESRVWGSHDCKIEAGTDERTLMGGSTVRVSVVWSGLSSEAKCAGKRQRVGAGTYTVYASLSGHDAKAAQFTMS